MHALLRRANKNTSYILSNDYVEGSELNAKPGRSSVNEEANNCLTGCEDKRK